MAALVLTAAAPSSVQRQAGEIVLTEAEQAEVLQGADDGERRRLATIFEDDAGFLPVAYSRAYFRVSVAPDGGATVREIGRSAPRPGSHLRLPDLRVASASGSTGRYDLYASVGIARLAGPGYRWVIASYFRWHGSSGIDACNTAEDSIATAWAGGLALERDSAVGYYQPYGGRTTPLDIYRSDVSPNLGVGWSFHELKQRGSQLCTNVNWGEGDAYLSEPSWAGATSNVIVKYAHTKGSGSYAITFSVPGISPTITLTPADSNQWTAAAFASFNH